MLAHAWLWWAAAAIFALLGFTLTARSLRGDPSRNRRRCPRCWYSMDGIPGLLCPECGRAQTDERRLHRARRAIELIQPPASR